MQEAEPFRLSPSAAARDEAADKLLAALNGQPTEWAAWAKSGGYDPKHGTARRARDWLRETNKVTRDGDLWLRATEAEA